MLVGTAHLTGTIVQNVASPAPGIAEHEEGAGGHCGVQDR